MNSHVKEFDRVGKIKNYFSNPSVSSFKEAVQDIRRSRNYIYINGEKIFSPYNEEDLNKKTIAAILENNLKNIQPAIVSHIKNLTHQDGFLTASQGSTKAATDANSQKIIKNADPEFQYQYKPRYDFILNHNHNRNDSVTFIERFY